MKSIWFRRITDTFDRITSQGDFRYDFGYDVAQKILFVLTVLLVWWMQSVIPDMAFIMYLVCMIIGRVVIMEPISEGINKRIEERGGRRSNKRFLHMPSGLWKLIVCGYNIYFTIYTVKLQDSVWEALGILVLVIVVVDIVGFFIYAGVTNIAATKSDPKKVGSAAWREENGVVTVKYGAIPLYRDKYGNYYRGTQFVPVPAPVSLEDIDK